MSAGPRIVAIGQLPPPITGFSYITSCVVERWRTSHDVISFDVAPPAGSSGFRKGWRRICRFLKAALGLCALARGNARVCYLACEGGAGLWSTLAFVIIARLCRFSILLHHHSFTYIDQPRRLMGRIVKCGGFELLHIFLCERMRDAFQSAYDHKTHSRILSNAAFVPPQSWPSTSAPDPALVLGLLSNLTREKGLYVYLDLIRATFAAGLQVRGLLAGPVASPADREAIARAVVELGDHLRYLGPLFGQDKQAFYDEVDVFVFPTQYNNEAQPIVLFEAKAAGCLVITSERGCIPGQLAPSDRLVPRNDNFVAAAVEFLSTISRDTHPMRCDRPARAAQYSRTHQLAQQSLFELLRSGASTQSEAA